MRLHQEAERIFRELGLRASLQASLAGQANVLYQQGELEGAMRLHKEEERICRELGLRAELVASLDAQALILADRGDVEGAMRLHKEAERICRELGLRTDLQRSLGNQAVILHQRGDLEGAMELCEKQERICRELGLPDGLARSLANQALFLAYSMERPDEALERIAEAHELATQHGYSRLAARTQRVLARISQMQSPTGTLPSSFARDSGDLRAKPHTRARPRGRQTSSTEAGLPDRSTGTTSSGPRDVDERAVRYIRSGRIEEAISVLRRRLYPRGGVTMREDADPVTRSNFAVALYLSGRVSLPVSIAEELAQEGHETSDSRIIRKWHEDLTRWQRLKLACGRSVELADLGPEPGQLRGQSTGDR